MCVTWLIHVCVTWLIQPEHRQERSLMCDMTRWYDSLTWLIDMTHWHETFMCVWHDSFNLNIAKSAHSCVTWLVDMTHWHDSVIWLIDMNHSCVCDMTHSTWTSPRALTHVWLDLLIGLIDMTYWYDSLTWLINMTHWYDSLTWIIHVCVPWLILPEYRQERSPKPRSTSHTQLIPAGHATHMNASCHVYKWVMSHICKWVMSHVWISHVTHIHVYCYSYPLLRTCSSHQWVMSHM